MKTMNYYFMLNLTVAILLYNFERASNSEFNQLIISKLKEKKVNRRRKSKIFKTTW